MNCVISNWTVLFFGAFLLAFEAGIRTSVDALQATISR
jgi:hypothetical protein